MIGCGSRTTSKTTIPWERFPREIFLPIIKMDNDSLDMNIRIQSANLAWRQFMLVLKKKKVYDAFIRAYCKFHQLENGQSIEDYARGKLFSVRDGIWTVQRIIAHFDDSSVSFHWADSHEGYTYWHNFNHRIYNDYVKKPVSFKKEILKVF